MNNNSDNTRPDWESFGSNPGSYNTDDHERLLHSEFIRRSLFEFNPLMYFALDSSGNVISVNDNGAIQLGYKKEELINRPVIEVFHEDDKEFVRKQLRICMKSPGKSYSWQLRKVRGDGEVIYVKEFVTAIRQNSGEIYTSVFCEDITEKVNANNKLKLKINKLENKNTYEQRVRIITQTIHESVNTEAVLDNAVKSLEEYILAADSAIVYLIEDKSAVVKSQCGIPDWYLKVLNNKSRDNGIVWKTVSDGIPRCVQDTDRDIYTGKHEKKLGIKSYISAPVWFVNKVIGVIQLNSYTRDAFGEDDIKLVKIVSRQLENALNNARQVEFLRNAAHLHEENSKQISRDLRDSRKKMQAEIQRREVSEKELKTVIEEKDFLLKKLQQRVKNNLQIIISLVQLQAREIKSQRIRELYSKTLNRIQTIAYLEEMLDDSNNISGTEFNSYLKRVVYSLISQYNKSAIEPHFRLDNSIQHVNINTAMPCGLILNELISNVFEHGFKDISAGWIGVSFHIRQDKWILSVSDNGCGLPEQFSMAEYSKLGLRLATSLSEQLNGHFTHSVTEDCTEFKIEFTEDSDR